MPGLQLPTPSVPYHIDLVLGPHPLPGDASASPVFLAILVQLGKRSSLMPAETQKPV